jgi:hypothetical protein
LRTPPRLDAPAAGANVFQSYFENEHGEQWILVHDAANDRVVVYSGDCGWENELTVLPFKESIAALPQEVADSYLERANSLGATRMATLMGKNGPVILSETEAMWLNACLRVVAYRRGEA